MGAEHTLTGTLTVALPPGEAFRLFTARGEQAWVDGWQPHFPVETPDDTTPGTVFETTGHGQVTTWLVLESAPARRISYARVTPGVRAGTVTVELSEETAGQSEVTVTYALTALTDAARADVRAFADGYQDFLRSWEDTIAAHLSGR